NATITFMLDNQSCQGVTDANGIASCTLTPDAAGLLSLTATFPGTAQYMGESTVVGFMARASANANVCPQGQGFWKNHSSAWPVSTLTLGSQTYTQAELLTILQTPTGGEASPLLADQPIPAKINNTPHSAPTPGSAAITGAPPL